MAGQSGPIDGCSWWEIGVPFAARLLVISSHVQSLLPVLVSMTHVLLFILLFKETAVDASFKSVMFFHSFAIL